MNGSREGRLSALAALRSAASRNVGAVKVTLLGEGLGGLKLVLGAEAEVIGGQPPEGWPGLSLPKLQAALASGQPWRETLQLRGHEIEAVCEPFPARPRLLVCGAGHVAVALVRTLNGLQWNVTVLDDRQDFALPERFAGATVWAEPFDQGLEHFSPRDGDFIVLVTRGHQQDLACLRTLLASPWRYLGMIGSRRRVWAVLRLLREEGFPSPRLLEVHAPIGLDIEAETPEEIGVAVAAEMIKVLRGGRAASLRDRHAGSYERDLGKVQTPEKAAPAP